MTHAIEAAHSKLSPDIEVDPGDRHEAAMGQAHRR